jgi:hypothetical protein
LEKWLLLSAYVERNKKFFRKIEICQNLPSKFAEKWAVMGGRNNKLEDKGSQMTIAILSLDGDRFGNGL